MGFSERFLELPLTVEGNREVTQIVRLAFGAAELFIDRERGAKAVGGLNEPAGLAQDGPEVVELRSLLAAEV